MSASAQPPDEQNINVAEGLSIANPLNSAATTGENIGTLDDIGLTETASAEGRKARLKRIGKPIASFFGVQVIVQILTMLSGLLLVHYLSKTEYAYYTIINTMQGTIGVLGDNGITTALSTIGGIVWQDRRRFGELIQTALEFRRKFGLIVCITVGPIMWWLLYSNGSGASYALLLSVIVLTGASLSLVHGVLVMVPRLHSRTNQLQKAELTLAFLRLILIGSLSFVFINAAVAATIFLITLAIQNYLYRRWAAVDADLNAPTNLDDRREIWKMVRHQAPGGIFYCLQSQIFILIIGIFGNTNDVANVGALGRLTIIFSIISVIMTNIILPHVARCNVRKDLQRMYIQIVGFYLVTGLLFICIVIAMPNSVLWLLGSKYANLSHELAYLTFNTVVGAVVGIIYSLNSTKGWIKGSWLFIPISLITQVLMLPFVNLSSIADVALLGAIPNLAGGAFYAFQSYQALKNYDENKSVT